MGTAVTRFEQFAKARTTPTQIYPVRPNVHLLTGRQPTPATTPNSLRDQPEGELTTEQIIIKRVRAITPARRLPVLKLS